MNKHGCASQPNQPSKQPVSHTRLAPARPIRIAMLARVVYPLHGFGGIERHVFHLVTHLARLGVHITLFVQTTNNHAAMPPDQQDAYTTLCNSVAAIVPIRYDYTTPLLPPNGIVGRQINYPWYTWQLGRAAAAAVRRGEIDLVHSQGLCATGYGAIRQRDPLLRQIPFVANPHGMEEYRTPDWRKWLAYAPFRLLYSYGHRCADRAIATDACTRDDVPRYLGVAPERVVVIPSAIDSQECLHLVDEQTCADLRQRFNLDGAEPLLLSVGRLERNKGYHILIDALARLHPTMPPTWRWVLVGQGREQTALQQQAAQAGIANHITMTGRLNGDRELHSFYELCDIVVHPTLYEGSSLVTLEGMIHQRPVIASAAGGIPDKIVNGRNGYLVRPGDRDDLVDKLRLALEHRSAWAAWGKESVRIVQTTFDWTVVARQTKDLYETLVGS